jgi:hypothetical protein
MKDLDLDLDIVRTWFEEVDKGTHRLVVLRLPSPADLQANLGLLFRRCYITDGALATSVARNGVPEQVVIASCLPDPGSTMSGDFGEVVAYLYQGSRPYPVEPLGATKWRLKQDRRKPAPHSDVVHVVLPLWPASSEEDVLLCSEVKAKATAGSSRPIEEAVRDCAKDRLSRLSKTLEWLKERALREDIGDLQLAHLDRFIKAVDHPPATRRFHAVAVVCSELLDGELPQIPSTASDDYAVVVISVPQLKVSYTAVFEAALGAGSPAPVTTEHL